MDKPPLRVRRGRSGRPWDRMRARVFAEETHCRWCHRWVDQDLPPTHRMSRTVDHLQELWQGGDPLDRDNLGLFHRLCNSLKSNQLRGRRRPPDSMTINAASL